MVLSFIHASNQKMTVCEGIYENQPVSLHSDLFFGYRCPTTKSNFISLALECSALIIMTLCRCNC